MTPKILNSDGNYDEWCEEEIIKSLINFEIDFKILNNFMDLIRIYVDKSDYHKLEMANLIVSNHVKNYS